MNSQTSQHNWFTEQIAIYLTDGLSAEERANFQAHAAQCADCAAKLAWAKGEDESLRGLFAEIEPAPGFEDRVIQRLRTSGRRKFSLPRPIRLHPAILRAAGAAAAIVVIGGLGFEALQVMQTPARNQARLTSNLRQIGQAVMLDREAVGVPPPNFGVAGEMNPGAPHEKDGQNVFDGNGRDAFRYNPFAGPNRENIYARASQNSTPPSRGLISSPYIANDAVLLPTDDDDGPATQPPSPAPGYAFNAQLSAAAPGAATYFQPAAGKPVVTRNTAAMSSDLTVDRKAGGGGFGRGGPAPTLTPGEVAAAKQLQVETQDDFGRRPPSAALRRATAPVDNGATIAAANEVAQPSPAPATEETQSPRKIIRHGEMSFEVDSFDSAFLQITKIAAEEGGFIADTDSNKLDNGKMSGTVTVRVPPEHLDTLILKLRALGDLKGQKIVSDDITREYTDLQSELRAATAMEDRLLDIIKKGSGQVKDLLAAEREVGVWREKIEQVTGEINYDNNLISLSTLRITLTERDIRQAALASEREKVEMGIETEDVEKVRDEAMQALDGVKARIIQADLRKLDAGQFEATITADVSPDAAGPVIDGFKQLGRVARLNIDREQTMPQGTTAPPGLKVDRLDTQLQISLYNLANVAARQTTIVSMACPDVEKSYHAIIADVTGAGGRIVNSSLNRVKPEQTDGTVTFDVPREKASAVLAQIRDLGEVMQLTVTENPDAGNVTDAKQGFDVTLASSATVAPRDNASITLMPGQDVAPAYQAMLALVRKDQGNITTAQLQEQTGGSDSATLAFDVSREHEADIEKSILDTVGTTGRVISRQNSRSTDTQHTLDSKVGYTISFTSADALQPRETTTRLIAVADVSGTYGRVLAAGQQAGAKIVVANLDQSNPASPSGQLDLIFPRSQIQSVEKAIADSGGGTVSRSVARSADLNSTTDDKVELRLTIGDLNDLPPRQTTTMNVQVSDPESSSGDLQAAALAAGGRIVEQHLVKDDKYEAHLVVEVPLSKGADFVNQVRDSGTVQTIERTENLNVPEADFAEAKLDITLTAGSGIVGPNAGLWQGLRNGLSASVHGLAYSLELVTIGVCLALPWAAIVWFGWKLLRRFRTRASI